MLIDDVDLQLIDMSVLKKITKHLENYWKATKRAGMMDIKDKMKEIISFYSKANKLKNNNIEESKRIDFAIELLSDSA